MLLWKDGRLLDAEGNELASLCWMADGTWRWRAASASGAHVLGFEHSEPVARRQCDRWLADHDVLTGHWYGDDKTLELKLNNGAWASLRAHETGGGWEWRACNGTLERCTDVRSREEAIKAAEEWVLG